MAGASLTVITGPMFGSKTSMLIGLLNRASIAKQKTFVFKPEIDIRFSENKVVSRSGDELPCFRVKNTKEMFETLMLEENKSTFMYSRPLLIGIDEVQFLDSEIYDFIKRSMKMGISFVVSGLDLDYKEEPFEIVSKLLSLADKVEKLTAVCTRCFSDANRTYRTTESKERVLVGNTETYTALCSSCFQKAELEKIHDHN